MALLDVLAFLCNWSLTITSTVYHSQKRHSTCLLIIRACLLNVFLQNRQSLGKAFKHGWERHAIALERPRICHIKNILTCGLPKTLYDVLSCLFVIHSFAIILIALFIISLVTSSVRVLFVYFFFFIVTFSFSCTCYLLNTLRHS